MKGNNKNLSTKKSNTEDNSEFSGYPVYPQSEEMYNRGIQEQNIDPEDVFQQKEPKKKIKYWENSETEQVAQLDVPGAELDDADENVGNEDEENNYYSIGGDDHNQLEEAQEA